LSKSSPVSEHHYRRRVQFAEVDSAQIVHFSHFFRYMEEAEHSLWRAAGLSISTRGDGFSYPRVAASFEYHAPLHLEEEFDVHLRIVKITRASMAYACGISRGGDRLATGSLTIVCVTRGEDGRMTSAPFPDDVRRRFDVAVEAGA
jgi:YbgC/YbaW family acyl-CoA thioester hydrolase